MAPSTLGFPGRLLFPYVTIPLFVLIGTVDWGLGGARVCNSTDRLAF